MVKAKTRCLLVSLLTLLFSLSATDSFGQQRDSIYVGQYVKNSFTKYGVRGALVTVMDSTGAVIDTVRTETASGSHDAQAWFLTVPRKPSVFRIRAEHPDYEPAEMTVAMRHPARLNEFRFPDLLMKIRADRDNEVQLGEVTVRATKVQLYYRGDTIVVDARAFKLSEGSMLDALVRSVPGCELRDNGDIIMNGKKVDYLTLNGKDFFKGNNRMMLDNLPYYTVDKLQFYNQQTERSQLLANDAEKVDYVMNVALKREYSIGYMVNADVAAGTHDRWLGRLFALRFTDNSRLALFGNANNVSENGQPGSNGSWSTTTTPTGDNKFYNAGGELMIDDKGGRYKETLDAAANWRRSTDELRTTSESFLLQGTAFNLARQNSRLKSFGFDTSNRLTLKRIGLISDTRLSYGKHDDSAWMLTSQLTGLNADFTNVTSALDSIFSSAMDTRLLSEMVNRTSETSAANGHKWNASQALSFHKELPWGDDLSLTTSGKWADSKNNTLSSYVLYVPKNTQSNEDQKRDNRNAASNYECRFGASYSIHLFNQWHITLADTYNQRREAIRSNLFRLDWDDTYQQSEVLPSMVDYARLQDWSNSWHSVNLGRNNEFSVMLHSHKRDAERGRYTSFTATLPACYTWQTEDYSRNRRTTRAVDHRWLFRPSVDMEHNTRQWHDTYIFHYNMEMRSPDLTQKVDFTDTSNPLALLKGNTDLRPSQVHNISFVFTSRFGAHAQFLMLQSSASIMRDLVAQDVSYNSQTGAYTYQPANVNGNWNSTSVLTFRRALTMNRRLNFESNSDFAYYRNVDLKADVQNGQSRRSVVDRRQTGERVKLEYKYGKWQVAFSGSAAWNNIHRHEVGSTDINSQDFGYGVTLNSELPWQLHLATDAKMYSRRGYSDRSLNSDDLVWNAQLERSLCHGRLNLAVKAFDLLHQISQTHVAMNAQGRTETWQLSLPNYVMLHLVYHWNKNPKKKK